MIVRGVAGQAAIDLIEREFRQQRDAVEGLLAVDREIVTERLERFARESVVDSLGFLQADNIGLPFVQPSDSGIQPLFDRIDVPGGDAHG